MRILQLTTPIMDMEIIMGPVGMVVEDGAIIIGMGLEPGIPAGAGVVLAGVILRGAVAGIVVLVGAVAVVGTADSQSLFFELIV